MSSGLSQKPKAPSASSIDCSSTARLTFKVLIVVTLLTATIEAVGIALLMPLIAVLQGQQGVSFAVVGVAVEFDESVAFYAVLVLGAFLLKSGLLLLRIRSALNLTNRLWRRWVMLIVDRQLYAPVRVVGMTDSGQAVATGLGETRACARALLNLQQLIAGLATFFCVYVVLWLSSWRATIGATLLIAAVGALCLRPMARLAHAAGVRQVAALKKASSQLIEIVGGHRDIRAYGTEDYFVTRIGEPLRELESSYTTTHWLASIVHPLVEVVMVGGFCATIIVLSPTAIDLSTSLPLLGVFAAAAFRLFPVTSALSAQWLRPHQQATLCATSARRHSRRRARVPGEGGDHVLSPADCLRERFFFLRRARGGPRRRLFHCSKG